MTVMRTSLTLGTKIGQGQFGEVFLGQDAVQGEVAVKVLTQQPSETAADWQLRKDGLLAEGQRLKQATHNNVVQVFQLLESETSNSVQLVMEYCSGGSLQVAFDRGPMRLAAVRKIVTEIAFGLQALHSRGMLHRDIKPGNLLLAGNGRAKLGDFGLVTDNIILGYGSQAGYADHIAPEVWNGSGTSMRTDIWAFGMTIYRLLHGAEWYSQSVAPRFIVADGGFANSLRWLPHVPSEWRRFVRRMLRDDPHARYQNAGEVVAALANLPTEPDWICGVTASEVRWRRRTDRRRVFAIWKRLSARRYEWAAWSEPVGKGNRRTLNGSNGIIGRARSERELEEFLLRRPSSTRPPHLSWQKIRTFKVIQRNLSKAERLLRCLFPLPSTATAKILGRDNA